MIFVDSNPAPGAGRDGEQKFPAGETAGAAGGVSPTSSSTSDGIRPSNVWRGYPRYLWGIVTLALALNMDQDLDKGR